MVNRFDTGLLVLPALGRGDLAGRVARGASCRSTVGMLPLAAWEVFSVVYYGFPFPNTAYSKLKTGVPAPEIHYQGFLYLLDSIANDPLTLLVDRAGASSRRSHSAAAGAFRSASSSTSCTSSASEATS